MHNISNLIKNDQTYRPYANITKPIAKEIIDLISKKEISYAQACEALDIAKFGIENLTISY